MSNSGSGRWGHFSEPASEPLPDPKLAAYDALERRLKYMRHTDRVNILDALDVEGLTVCWKAPSDE